MVQTNYAEAKFGVTQMSLQFPVASPHFDNNDKPYYYNIRRIMWQCNRFSLDLVQCIFYKLILISCAYRQLFDGELCYVTSY